MRKSQRLCTWLMCMLMILALLAGCAQGADSVAPSSAPPPVASEPAEEEPAAEAGENLIGTTLVYDLNAPVNGGEDITITFWYPDDVQDICEKYTALYSEIHPNVTFEASISPWDDYWTKLPIAIANGTGPDLFWMHNAYTDTMVPITEPMPEDVFPLDALNADFRQVDLHLIEDKLYYIDTGLMSSIVMYNKAMWDEAGLTDADIPTTWDELREVAKAMTVTDDAGSIVVSGFSYNGENGFVNMVTAMNYQKGMFVFSEDGATSIYDDPVTIENMEYLKSWYDEDKIGDTRGVLNRDALGQGQTAMINDWTWIPGYIEGTFPDIELGFFPTPSFDGNPAAYDRNNGECSPCVSAKADDANKAVAFDFVKYLLANDDFIREFSLSNGIFPSKYSLDDDPEIAASPVHQALKAIINDTIWQGPLPGLLEENLGKYLQDDFLYNGVSAADAVAKVDATNAQDMQNLGFVPVERRYHNAAAFKN